MASFCLFLSALKATVPTVKSIAEDSRACRRSGAMWAHSTLSSTQPIVHVPVREAHWHSIHFAKCVLGTSKARQNMSDHQKISGTYSEVDTT